MKIKLKNNLFILGLLLLSMVIMHVPAFAEGSHKTKTGSASYRTESTDAELNKELHKKAPKKTKKKNLGLTGEFNLKQRLDRNDPSIAVSLKWKPKPKDYWFFRVGVDYKLKNQEDQFTYSWGLGYDDWHPGTWSFEINNWGGIKSDEGLDIDDAVASVLYRIKSERLDKLKLSSTISLSKEFDQDAKFKTSLQWKPKPHWFVKAILTKPLNSDDVNWSYVFGYDDWHPSTFGFEFSNYEANELFDTNFSSDARFRVSYKWKR